MQYDLSILNQATMLLDPRELRPGDIFIFNDPAPNLTHFLIQAGQIFKDTRKGHFQNVHAAICVSEVENDKVLIAHVTGNRNFVIDQKNIDHISKHTILVFRPRNYDIAIEAAKVAANNDNRNIRWSLSEGVKAIFFPTEIKYATIDAKVDKKSICSKFVVDCFHAAISNLNKYVSYMEIDSNTSTTKDLEAYLRSNNDCYKKYVIPQSKENIFEFTKSKILTYFQQASYKKEFACIQQVIYDTDEMLKNNESLDKLNYFTKTLILVSQLRWALISNNFHHCLDFIFDLVAKEGVYLSDIDIVVKAEKNDEVDKQIIKQFNKSLRINQ